LTCRPNINLNPRAEDAWTDPAIVESPSLPPDRDPRYRFKRDLDWVFILKSFAGKYFPSSLLSVIAINDYISVRYRRNSKFWPSDVFSLRIPEFGKIPLSYMIAIKALASLWSNSAAVNR
jgi:hypothetical protein